MVGLIDCNNFYVSCERVFNPTLKGKPVIVLSNNDGCTIARSEEAKGLGIEMGTPVFMISDLIKKHDVKVFSSNYTLYGDMSNRVISVITEFVHRTEVYSIDEIFVDFTGLKYTDLQELGKEIRDAVMRCTGISVSVGIARTKTLAKMANRYAKKAVPDVGVYYADSKAKTDTMLRFTKAGDIWGVGGQYEKLLKKNGFITAADFVNAPEEWIRKNMHVVGQRTLNELKGIACLKWEDEAPKKNICTSRSFGKLITTKKEIQQAIATFTANCGQKLRKQNSCATKLHVFINTNIHRKQDEQYFHSITLDLAVATNSTRELLKYAMTALNLIYKPGYNYHKTGVIVLDLIPQDQIQLGLFDRVDREKDEKVMKALDNVNKSFGRDVVRTGTQGFNKKWKLRQEHLSNCFTTRFDQLMIVKAS